MYQKEHYFLWQGNIQRLKMQNGLTTILHFCLTMVDMIFIKDKGVKRLQLEKDYDILNN